MFEHRDMPKVMLIKWIDSALSHGWQYDDDIDCEEKLCFTIGFIVKESEKAITVASTISELPDQSAAMITIPKVAIVDQKAVAP